MTSNIRRNIKNLLEDNENFETSGEYEFNPEVVKASVDSAYYTNRIPEMDYKNYLKILEQIKVLRRIKKENERSIKAKKDYINDLIFWNN